MKILITGSEGFIAKNLKIKIIEYKYNDIFLAHKKTSKSDLISYIKKADFIFHLAAVNRTSNDKDFLNVNYKLTKFICDQIKTLGKKVPIIFTSTIHINKNTLYAKSKKKAEKCLIDFSKKNKSTIFIYRLPNVYGKWAKPNYNSVVSTFCYNIANDIPIKIYDDNETISLVHIDSVIDNFIKKLKIKKQNNFFEKVKPVYTTKIKLVANYIKSFNAERYLTNTVFLDTNLKKTLYGTFCSYLPKTKFSYLLKENIDYRGEFVEVFKNQGGQISYFTAFPNIIRGEHYHHTKVEKFLVLEGNAKFYFKNIITNETKTIKASGIKPKVVYSIPGWAHSVENIGNKKMIVSLWASEVFNIMKPDTIFYRL